MSSLSTSASLTGPVVASDLCYCGLGAARDGRAGQGRQAGPVPPPQPGRTHRGQLQPRGTGPLPGDGDSRGWDRTSARSEGTRVRPSPGWPRHQSAAKEVALLYQISGFPILIGLERDIFSASGKPSVGSDC